MGAGKSLVKGMNDLHRMIIMQAAMGDTPSKIAEMFNLSIGGVRGILKSAQGLRLTGELEVVKKNAIEQTEMELCEVVVDNVPLLRDTIEGRVKTQIPDLDEDGQLQYDEEGDVLYRITYEVIDPKMRVDTLFKVLDRIGISPLQRGEVTKNVKIGLVNSQDVLDEIKLEAEVEAVYEEITEEELEEIEQSIGK